MDSLVLTRTEFLVVGCLVRFLTLVPGARVKLTMPNLMPWNRAKVLKVSEQSTSVERFVEAADNGARHHHDCGGGRSDAWACQDEYPLIRC